MQTMAEQATQTIIIEAAPELCLQVATDFPSYPDWAVDVKQAEVLESDEQGRPVEVEFRAAAMGRSTHYTLRYDYSGAPERLAWKLVAGDLMRGCDGSYQFRALEGGRTEVIYNLAIELVVPLPGFVKRRAEVRILNTVRELKTRVESVGD
jgi:ribosome-associated toxin RatA of RatAB toxin-antitoxin module